MRFATLERTSDCNVHRLVAVLIGVRRKNTLHQPLSGSVASNLVAAGVNVDFVLFDARPPAGGAIATGEGAQVVLAEETVPRYLTLEQAALLDNYEAADDRGRVAARSVLDALTKQKAGQRRRLVAMVRPGADRLQSMARRATR